MLTLSKPLSASQAARYHADEFSNARGNYYTEGDEIRGQWHGRLAAEWGLSGLVSEEHFQRLADGRHPVTDESLVRHHVRSRWAHDQAESDGSAKSSKTQEHRAGWDATFSAPKSVSLTALVGGDTRVRDAHRESVGIALGETERFVQARLGGNLAPETTGNWVVASFEHDSARPVDGYSAPQLHTHAVFFNVTQTESGDIRPIQPRELYKTQQYATAVYRSELAARLVSLGYEIDRGGSGQPEIRGYTVDYLEASSPRRRQIEQHLAQAGQHGAAAAQIAAHHTREAKLDRARDEVRRQHQALAATFGDQPGRVVRAAEDRSRVHADNETRRHPTGHSESAVTPAAAVTFARDRNIEREAVVDERDVLRDALKRSMGDLRLADVRSEFESRIVSGDLIERELRPNAASRAFTTPEMIALERETIELMRAGQGSRPPMVDPDIRRDIARDHEHLSATQRGAVDQILSSQDQVQALEGVAGGGKTTALAAIRDGAERSGYLVEGFAPTSRAAQQLSDAAIAATTLQRHLSQEGAGPDGRKHLYVLDESSLASTVQMQAFLQRLREEDRVLLVGDVRQHQAVDAGRPYQQLHEAGIEAARLDDIVRQKDPELKAVVECLARGEVSEAINLLDAQRRVHQVPIAEERVAAIAREYVKDPAGTLIVSPDNQSRSDINDVIHRAMQATGHAGNEEHQVRVLLPRQDITGPDRRWAEKYEPGNVVRFTKGSEVYGLDAREYARVEAVDAKANLVRVERDSGERVMYDPRRLEAVTVYRETDRALSVGDRVQFTAPDRERHIANRELATIESIDASGRIRLRLDEGRLIELGRDQPIHLDYGYAVTSHSSQGQTAERVLIHIDTERGGEQLINRRLAYVAVSRGRHDAQIYTNDKAQLGRAISRDVSHSAAIEPGPSRMAAGHQVPARLQTPADQGVAQSPGI